MGQVHFIAMDTHRKTTDICVKTRANGPGKWYRVATTIPAIRGVIEQVPGRRKLTLEEGPLADWLWRNLREHVEEAVVCDPRRNALVAREGDKDDPIDAGKLCDLWVGGFVREVHHAASLERQVCKQAVGLYHGRVRQRVRCANVAMGLLKRWGVMARERDFARVSDRAGVLRGLGDSAEARLAAGHVELLWRGYDEAVFEERQMRRQIIALGKQDQQVVRWQALPGVGWVRGMTFLAYLDTPWRFKSKQALWKYMGIGLVREHSGGGPTFVRVDQSANRVLRGAIVGAAQSVILLREGVFYGQYERWREAGLSFKNARRNVARSLAATLWGMWKNGGEFDPAQVGVASGAAREVKGGGR